MVCARERAAKCGGLRHEQGLKTLERAPAFIGLSIVRWRRGFLTVACEAEFFGDGIEGGFHAFAGDAGEQQRFAFVGFLQRLHLFLHEFRRERVDLVQRDDFGTGSEVGIVGGEFLANGPVGASRIVLRTVDQVERTVGETRWPRGSANSEA